MGMLATCASLAVLEALEQRYVPVQHVLILALLGLIGFVLPSGKLLYKLLYTGFEFGLILALYGFQGSSGEGTPTEMATGLCPVF